jgi:tRNA dimethylallyltransferase
MKKALVILGPTATGKTDLALNLAKKINGELIAADSRQVYKGLDIGTGKLPKVKLRISKHQGFWEVRGIKIWLYDQVKLEVQYSIFDYLQSVSKVINKLNENKKTPIVVGGTGLYIRGLLKGFDNLLIPIDSQLRQELAQLSLSQLQSRVQLLSSTKWKNLNNSDKNNSRRLIRIIEQIYTYGYIDKNSSTKSLFSEYQILKIGLTAPRLFLNQKINQRVLDWFKFGILTEVKNLMDSGVPISRFKQLGLEYGLIAGYLNGGISDKEILIKLIQTKVRQYAKRQQTWFKKEEDVIWFDVTLPNWEKEVESLVTNWYNSGHD